MRWRDCRKPIYEGWHSRIAANKVAANAQTKISTHWSRVIPGSIEKGPTNHAKGGNQVAAGPRTAPSAEGGQRKAKLRIFLADRCSLLITRARAVVTIAIPGRTQRSLVGESV
jgi:hypothetical protein